MAPHEPSPRRLVGPLYLHRGCVMFFLNPDGVFFIEDSGEGLEKQRQSFAEFSMRHNVGRNHLGNGASI